jgi:ClpP class serine protease
LDARERAKIRELMVAFYDNFVSKAAAGRKKTHDEIDEVAQGRVWTGVDALRVGLVDRLGGLDVALDAAKERARIGKDQEVEVVVLPERKGLLETFLERQEEGVLDKSVPRDVRALLLRAVILRDRGPIARLPFDLSIR